MKRLTLPCSWNDCSWGPSSALRQSMQACEVVLQMLESHSVWNRRQGGESVTCCGTSFGTRGFRCMLWARPMPPTTICETLASAMSATYTQMPWRLAVPAQQQPPIMRTMAKTPKQIEVSGTHWSVWMRVACSCSVMREALKTRFGGEVESGPLYKIAPPATSPTPMSMTSALQVLQMPVTPQQAQQATIRPRAARQMTNPGIPKMTTTSAIAPARESNEVQPHFRPLVDG
mmetsp:Transcript_13568/g.31256  ORF Transcript_13568/g.31256 Transcript_13568/m.31256 type:complete len:231 (+) Transcript_13568:272-964(+)